MQNQNYFAFVFGSTLGLIQVLAFQMQFLSCQYFRLLTDNTHTGHILRLLSLHV
nr:MAG TPA: hypothetical protein [Caudoviricetes sp.]